MPESTRKTQMRSSSTGARPGSSMMARGKAHEDITAIADRLKAPSDAEQARLSNKCKKEHDSCVYAPHASAVYISERVLLSDQQTVQAIEPTSGTGLEWPNLDRQMLMKRILRCFWFPDPDAPPATALDTVVWRRVSGALYLPNGKLPKIVQGHATWDRALCPTASVVKAKTAGMGGVKGRAAWDRALCSTASAVKIKCPELYLGRSLPPHIARAGQLRTFMPRISAFFAAEKHYTWRTCVELAGST
eukprot:1157896-Pelagomonas_calceolata.AAC.16